MAQIMKLIGFVTPSQVGQLLRVTTTDIDRWDGTAWIPIDTGIFTGNTSDYFSVTSWGDEILLANGKDKIYRYNRRTGAHGFITESYPSRHIQNFGGRVIATGVVDGGYRPYRVRWCVKFDHLDWTGDGSGYEDLLAAPGGKVDPAQGCFPITDDTALLIRESTIWQMSLTGLVLTPFRFSRIVGEMGARARRSIVSYPDGYIMVSRENVVTVNLGRIEPIGELIRTPLIESIGEDWDEVVGAYDFKRNEYRLAVGNVVWRYTFRAPTGWTKDEYPEDIRDIDYVKIDKIGVVINDLVGKIDDLSTNYPPGKIDDLVVNLGIEGMFFIMYNDSTSAIVRETPTTSTDVNLDSEAVDSVILATTALLQEGTTRERTKVVEVQMEYESEEEQTLVFDYSIDAGVTWTQYSTRDIAETDGPTILSVRKTLVNHNLQLRVRSTTLGKIRIISFVPHVIREAKVHA